MADEEKIVEETTDTEETTTETNEATEATDEAKKKTAAYIALRYLGITPPSL